MGISDDLVSIREMAANGDRNYQPIIEALCLLVVVQLHIGEELSGIRSALEGLERR